MKHLTSRVLYKASPIMLAVALGLLGPAALNDDEEPSFEQDDAAPAPDADAPEPTTAG